MHTCIHAKLLKAKQLQHEQARFEAAEHAYDMDSHTLWKLVQSRKGSNLHSIVHDGVRHSSPEALLQVWNSHYESLLNEQESSSNSYDSDFGFHIQEEVDHLKNSMPHTEDTTGILRDPITVNEVAQVCGSMPNRKAPGADLISYESLKNGGHSLFVHLTNLYNAIIDQVYIPQPLKYNVIIPVHKGKRKPKDSMDSYRGISLGPTVNKVFERVIMNRLESHNFPPPLQHSCRRGTSCVSLTYMVQEVINHYCRQGSKLYTCLIDIKQAFDSINWNTLLYKLHKIGIEGKTWCLFNECLNNSTSSVMINGVLSNQFPITRSIKQGGLLSMFFFCVAYYDIHSEIICQPANALMYHGIDVSSPTFADDTMIISSSVYNLQAMLDNVYMYGNKWRITFSPEKSMCITFGETKYKNKVNMSSRQWYLGDSPLNEVDHVTYLGTKLCAYNQSVQRTQDRCKKRLCTIGESYLPWF